ncbi:synaptic vesicle glycoprotein 2B-like isoform X2 [Homalodisca vitripennis]|uniref:synaptic vesicle glycoprotein 2B-like isoform X2 n=1 Tax=Homalodisca vitripennis TaxID=197043 RepID=UPI001EEB532E|nr:synaptic vesicle glycoprotein 2B-like isoform X2 [Homalodisca vitripennis]
MPANQEKVNDVKFEDAMDIAGYGKFSMYIIFLSGLSIATSLLGSVDISFLLPAAECDLQLTSEDKGLIGSAYFIGTIASAHLSGFLADTMGRRYVILWSLALNVPTYVFGSLAPEFWTFFILKLISGILSSPTLIASIPFVGEFVPMKQRTQAILISSSLSAFSLVYSASVGWATLQAEWSLDLWLLKFTPWRLFYLLCGLPSLMGAVLFWITPESPKFLLSRGKKGDTLKVMQSVHSINSGANPQTYPVHSICMDAGEDMPTSPARRKGVTGVVKHVCDQTLPLLKPPYLTIMTVSVLSTSVTFLCINTVLLWLPEVTNRIAYFKQEHEGDFYMCEMMSYNSSVILDIHPSECHSTINTAVFLPNLVIALLRPLAMVFASIVLSFIDRKLFLMLCFIIGGMSTILIVWIPDATIIVILFGSLPLFTGICYNIIASFMVEFFPTYIRAMAVSLCLICGRLGSILGSQLFSHLIDSHCLLLFYLIAGMFLCCAPLSFCFNFNSKPVQNSNNQDLDQGKIAVPERKLEIG